MCRADLENVCLLHSIFCFFTDNPRTAFLVFGKCVIRFVWVLRSCTWAKSLRVDFEIIIFFPLWQLPLNYELSNKCTKCPRYDQTISSIRKGKGKKKERKKEEGGGELIKSPTWLGMRNCIDERQI